MKDVKLRFRVEVNVVVDDDADIEKVIGLVGMEIGWSMEIESDEYVKVHDSYDANVEDGAVVEIRENIR